MFAKILQRIKSNARPLTSDDDDVQSVSKPRVSKLCKTCQRYFADLNGHIKRVHLPGPEFKCGFCVFTCKTKRARDRHVREVHPQPSPIFRCGKCTGSVTFSKESQLKRHHQLIHPDKKKVSKKIKPKQECELCSAKFKTVAVLNHHSKVKHNAQEDQLLKVPSCPICDKTFAYEKGIAAHMRLAHEVHVTPYKCESCCMNFTSGRAKIEHDRDFRKVHAEKGLYKCRKCSRKLTSEYNRIKHEETHNKARTKCGICKKSFAHHQSLRTHLKNVHGSVQGTFKCPWCQTGFKLRAYMDDHLTRCRKVEAADQQQDVVMSFECLVCNETFPSLELLRCHDHNEYGQDNQQMESNTDLNDVKVEGEELTGLQGCSVVVTQFKCGSCSEMFASLELLNLHIHDRHEIEEDMDEENASLSADESEDSDCSDSDRSTETVKLFSIQCRHCPATFNSEELRTRHQLRAHPSKKY